MDNYIQWIREKVGHEQVFLNFAAAIIVNASGEILLQRREDGISSWGFPGGAFELGESAEETVIREVREETGLEIEIIKLLGVYTKYFQIYPNGDAAQTIVIFFICRAKSSVLKTTSPETLDLQWLDPRKAPRLFNKQHCQALEDYLADKYGVYR